MPNRYEVAYGVLLLIWAVSGGYITSANVKLGSYKKEDKYLNNAYWNTFAAAFVTWTLIGIIILLMILAAVGIIGLFATGAGEVAAGGVAAGEVAAGGVAAGEAITASEVAAGGVEALEGDSTLKKAMDIAKGKLNKKNSITEVSNVTLAILGVSLFLVTVSGILAAVSASQIRKSPNYNADDKKLQEAHSDCTIAAILCLGSAGILLIVMLIAVVSHKRAEDKIKEAKEILAKQQKEHALQAEKLKQEHDLEVRKLQEENQKAMIERQLELKRAHERSIIEKRLQDTKFEEAKKAAVQKQELATISEDPKPPIKPLRRVSKTSGGVDDPIPLSTQN
jgi:hypothetical protein